MIRILLALVAAVLLMPATAHAACGVAPARAIYETPSVQVYMKGQKIVACDRATGKSRGVGEKGLHTVVEVLGGRYIHMRFYASAAESADMQMDSVLDLRTDNGALAPVLSEEIDNQVVALPGAVITAGEEGVIARYTDDRMYEVISTAPADTIAATGSRIYWRDAAGVHTLLLSLPASDPDRALPRARTIGRCKPRPGARLVMRDTSIVVTKAGGATWACRRGKTRRVGGEGTIISDRFVAYTRPGFTGILDVADGRRRELPGSGAAGAWALVTAAPDGVRAWVYGDKAPKLLAPGAAREVAIGDTAIAPVAFWLDEAGNPQAAAI